MVQFMKVSSFNFMKTEEYEPVIGLEIHVELKTKSKMFCGCSTDYFGHEPNTHCCPVCLGLPGALPVPNKKAVEWCVMLGLALNCDIPEFSKFDRKNYFYPDLPKGYQISQYDKPFAVDGYLVIPDVVRNPIMISKNARDSSPPAQNDEFKRIRIRRVHMEEDTGKLLHASVEEKRCTLIDFNRSGVPLVEIVTEPDIRSSEEARIFLKKLYQIIRYLGISDADMEKGSMRLEPNISVAHVIPTEARDLSRMRGSSNKLRDSSPSAQNDIKLPSYKVEVKNINSFNFAKKAIDYEVQRQIEILKRGEIPVQETRGWDEKKGITYSQRSKEEAHDYRYFPEPDIPPIRWVSNQLSVIRKKIPELPDNKIKRFIKDYQLSEYDATILVDEIKTAEYYEEAIRHLGGGPDLIGDSPDGGGTGITPKTIANWIINKKADISKTSPEELIKLISQQSQKLTISDEELEKAIKKVIDANPKAVADYKSGKQQAMMFLLGQVMREIKGKAVAETIRNLLLKLLSN